MSSPDYIDPVAGAARERGGGGAGSGPLKVARAAYDFAVDGGAIGTHDLETAPLPIGAIVMPGPIIDVITPPASLGAATVALSLETENDLCPDFAVSGPPWTAVGPTFMQPTITALIKPTAARKIKATIAVAALTAGKFVVYLEYVEPL